MATHKVGYLIGSLAKASINRKLANPLVRLAPDAMAAPQFAPKVRTTATVVKKRAGLTGW
jgi:chromate reductase